MKNRKDNIIKRTFLSIHQHISDKDLQKYDAYITLTESINDAININQKPHIVIEGFADSEDVEILEKHENYIMYAGGVYEKYGVKSLVEAFMKIDRKDVDLYIFGEGTYVDELKAICAKNSRIKYMGCISTDAVVKKKKKALLLVNPRPTNEEFSKYSFPSKTIEYLLSGTAVVSTNLPGIPEEYFKYMFKFSDCTTEAIRKDLNWILSQSMTTLVQLGRKGHEYVALKKNNLEMTKKIFKFLKENLR